MQTSPKKYLYLLVCICLAAVTLAVYWSVSNHRFVQYDDGDYVTGNPDVKSGLSWQNIKWAFTADRASNWHPLTWMSHMVDCQLFGNKPGLHHLVNVLFHIINTILLLVVLNRMTKALWPSVFVAALFALHPLHVESVAWVAERKDVLSTFFWFLAMLAYVRYVERPTIGRYLVTIFLFAMGLMSKPMLVTLPLVLILLDYWPLNRFLNSKFSILNSVVEKIPFFFLSILSSVITFIVQQKTGAVPSIYVLPFDARIANAICSYFAYIEKMFWPVQLAVLYPHPVHGIPAEKIGLSAIILILITVLVFYKYRSYKYLLVGWLWYLGTLVPVIGIVQVGAQAMADRYTYVPLIGLFIVVAFGAADLLKRVPYKKYILSSAAILILLACALAASAQLKYWKDSVSLFEHTLAVTQNNVPMMNNYARILSSQGRHAEAVKYIAEVLNLLPNSPEIHVNYGNALKDSGKTDEAIEHYKIALKLNPNLALAHYNLGVALAIKGDYAAAIEQYKIYLGADIDLVRDGISAGDPARLRRVLADKPYFAIVLSNLCDCLVKSGNPQQAEEYCRKALQIDPNNQKARENLDAIIQKQSQH